MHDDAQLTENDAAAYAWHVEGPTQAVARRALTVELRRLEPAACVQRRWRPDPDEQPLEDLSAAVLPRLAPPLLPDDTRTVHEDEDEHAHAVILACADVLLDVWVKSGHVCVTAYGTTRAVCDEVLEAIDRVVPGADRGPGRVPVRFWHLSHGYADCDVRRIECPAWDDVSANYPCADEIGELMRMGRPWERGRLVFWGGPPGTGKTWAIRALARRWTGMVIEVVSDPDALFRNADYLRSVVVEAGKSAPPWWRGGPRRLRNPGRLIVLEDAPDLLGEHMRDREGGALARLLNLTDGILGQGLRVVFLITTNAELTDVDPALLRPGRALQVLHFRPFEGAEVRRWLAAHEADAEDAPAHATLAELYARLDGRTADARAAAGGDDRRITGFGG